MYHVGSSAASWGMGGILKESCSAIDFLDWGLTIGGVVRGLLFWTLQLGWKFEDLGLDFR
jgi:hypothetical protein